MTSSVSWLWISDGLLMLAPCTGQSLRGGIPGVQTHWQAVVFGLANCIVGALSAVRLTVVFPIRTNACSSFAAFRE